MRVIYVTTEGFDITNGNTHLNYTLVSQMLLAGIQVHLVQSFRNGNSVSIPPEFQENALFSCETISRNVGNKNRFIKRTLEEFHYYDNVSRHLKHFPFKKGDILFYQASGLMFYFVEKIKKHNVPIVLNMQDAFPDTLVTTGVCTNRLILSVLYRMQKRMLGFVHKVTVLSEDMRQNILARYQLPAESVEVIYNWYDDSSIWERPLPENRFAQKYNLKKDKFVVQYAGNLGHVLDYDAFVALGEKLKDHPDIVIQIVGNGSCEAELKEKIAGKKLTNFEFLEFQPLDLVPDVYSYCDVCFIPLKKGVIYHSVPSKASIVTACKRPVVMCFDAGTSYGSLFTEKGAGCVCTRETLQNAADYILQLKEDPACYHRQQLLSCELAAEVFSVQSNCLKEIHLLKTEADRYYG